MCKKESSDRKGLFFPGAGREIEYHNGKGDEKMHDAVVVKGKDKEEMPCLQQHQNRPEEEGQKGGEKKPGSFVPPESQPTVEEKAGNNGQNGIDHENPDGFIPADKKENNEQCPCDNKGDVEPPIQFFGGMEAIAGGIQTKAEEVVTGGHDDGIKDEPDENAACKIPLKQVDKRSQSAAGANKSHQPQPQPGGKVLPREVFFQTENQRQKKEGVYKVGNGAGQLCAGVEKGHGGVPRINKSGEEENSSPVGVTEWGS